MTVTLLTTYAAASVLSTDVTASVSPSGGALVIVVAGKRSGNTQALNSVTASFGTVSGFTRLGGAEVAGGRFQCIELWAAVASASPGSGTVTLQWSGNCSTSAAVLQVVGGDSVAGPASTVTGAGASAALTISPAPAASSLVIAALATTNDADGIVPDAAFAELADFQNTTGNPVRLQVQYRDGSAGSLVTWSGIGTEGWAAGGIEITAAATGGEAYTLTAETGTFAAAGQTATLRAARRMAADAGTFALTGQSATLSAGQVIAAETGTLTLTGQSAGLRAARHLTAEQGTFTATGQTSDLLRTYRIAADPGTLAATGQAAALAYTPASGAYTLAAEAGAFTATGQDAALTAARRIAATTGTYALTGQTATLAHGLTLTAEPGTLALAGQAATLTRTRIMAAETGAFTLSGQTAALTWSGRPVPTVPAERTYVVPFESRTFAVPYENRTLTA